MVAQIADNGRACCCAGFENFQPECQPNRKINVQIKNKKMKKELSAGTKDEQRTDADNSRSASVEASPMLAAVLIKAVLTNSWATMLEYYPEGVEHRTFKYNKPEHFQDWDTYEDYARYVAPAQEMLKDLCLGKALTLLSDCG